MEQETQMGWGGALAKKLGVILSVFVFLLPVFFFPVSGVSLYVAKVALLATGLVALFAVFLSSVLSSGMIEIPKAKFLLPILALVLVSFASSIFSGSINMSIVGSVFDLGTSGSIFLLVFAMFLTIVTVKNIGTMGRVVTAFIYGVMTLVAYTLLAVFVASWLPVKIASVMPYFPVGGAIDTSIIFGAAVILSLCAINMTEVSKKFQYALYVMMALALLFIAAVNFSPVVVILGIVALVFFVYILSWSVGRSQGEFVEGQTEGGQLARKISFSSLIVLLVSVILVLGGTGISGFLSKTMKVQTTEIRPNFQTTMDLTAQSWKKNFALGIGPNRFADFWSANKPIEINRTQFWNVNFYSGSGFVPTMAITTGLLGLLSILAFIVLYVLSGVKAIFAQANAVRSRYLSVSSFLVSLYFWIILFLYSPSITVLALAFIFTGLFASTLVPQGTIGLWKINIFSNPKINFLSVLSIVILLIVSVAGGYFVWEKAVASVVFEKGVLEYRATGNIAAARESIAKAINVSQNDVYWLGLTEISLANLGNTLSGITNQNQVTENLRVEIQNMIGDSVNSAKKAIEVNGSSFQNWFALGRVYEVLASNGIEGAADSARSAYTEAGVRSPNNPSVPLALARLNALAGDTTSARQEIIKALELKNNYTDAYYTLAQLEIASNNIPAAISSVEAATIVDPSNAGLYFQLGVLKYNQKNWNGAADALGRAIALVPDYANAKYFLGLSYYRLGKKAEALSQFKEILATNPGNSEIAEIINRIEDGKSPFVEGSDDSSELPVKED